MINGYILETLKQNNVKDTISFENTLREVAQKIVLYALSRTSFFRKAAFYGGTCLRIFHNLQRFSEDLDFNITESETDFSWNDYTGECLATLESYGLEAEITSKPEYDTGEIRRRYIKIACAELAREYFNKDMFHKDKKVTIKLEVSTWHKEGANYSIELLNAPTLSSVKCHDMPTLFAGKLSAVINRSWGNRTKGRDFYDYVYYISLGIKYNLNYIKHSLALSMNIDPETITENTIKQWLKERFETVNYEQIMADINPFVLDGNTIQAINKDLLLASIDKIQCE